MDLLAYAKDRDLPMQIINYIKERSLDEETDCLQLLICKSSPFIWGMQRSLMPKKDQPKEKRKRKGVEVMLEFMPSFEEVAQNSEQCDRKHPFCFVDL